MKEHDKLCCLCGTPGSDEDPITREHVPPKQFYPKSMRAGLNLWIVPTHKSCNKKNKSDEEYFYHFFSTRVAEANPEMGATVIDDLRRRAANPQTPKLIQSIFKSARTVSKGGVQLPPGTVRISGNEFRLQQVAIKIGRCLYFREHQRVMPEENCMDVRFCECEEDVPELYRLSWELSKVNVNDMRPSDGEQITVVTNAAAGAPHSACERVFDYRSAVINSMHLYTLRFWQSFVFCIGFDEPTQKGKVPVVRPSRTIQPS